MYGSVNEKGYTLDDALKSVGAGWAQLVQEVFSKMEQLGNNIKIVQVKEKYGGLRIYTNVMHDEFEKVILDVERRSYTICDTCGVPGKLRSGGWYRTLCDEHAGGRPIIEGGF